MLGIYLTSDIAYVLVVNLITKTPTKNEIKMGREMKIKINTPVLFILIAVFLTGCNFSIDNTSNQSCTQVSNADIQSGSIGHRAVYLHDVANGFVIGYDEAGKHVPHSQCTAATMSSKANASTYSWFLFGHEVEVDTIKSIMFYLNSNGEASTLAMRFAKASTWQEQNVENNKVTRQFWTAQPNIKSIDVRDNYNGDKLKKLIAEIGNVTKTVVYDANSNAYNCTWVKGSTVVTDTGCANSPVIDTAEMGFILDHAYYFRQLETAKVEYGTSKTELDNQINRYFR